jgi:hypothetical protein
MQSDPLNETTERCPCVENAECSHPIICEMRGCLILDPPIASRMPKGRMPQRDIPEILRSYS